MRILTDEDFVQAQIQYMKEHNLSHFPLTGEARDDCNRKAQAALTLKEVGEWLDRRTRFYQSDIEAFLRGEMPE